MNSSSMEWITEVIRQEEASVLSKARQDKQKRKRKFKHTQHKSHSAGDGENISAFINHCDPVSEMVRSGLLIPGRGNEFRWYESENDRSCDILNGSIHIFSHSMSAASPAAELEPVGVHRFYLYQLSGLDMTKDSDKPKCREFLFDLGYGSDPKAFVEKRRKRSAPIRLKVRDCQQETQALEDQREKLRQEIKKVVAEKRKLPGKHIINVTSAAGTGKTTIIITTYDNLLFITKTKEEADQAFSIADSHEKDAWRHRPRMHNREEKNWEQMPLGLAENQRPCMYPEICNNLILRGHDIVPSFCAPFCEHYTECRARGFLKQYEIEPAKQQVFMSWTDMVFSDVRFESRVKDLLDGEKLLVLDEANPTHLPQKREIVTKDLLDILESWRLPTPEAYELFVFLNMLIQELSTAKKPEQIRAAFKKSLKVLTDDEIQQMDNALAKVPVGLVYKRDTDGELHAIAIHGDNIEKKLYISDAYEPPDGFDGTIPTDFAKDGVEIDKLKVIKVDIDLFQRFGFCDMRTQSHAVPRKLLNFIADLKTFVDTGSKACFKDEKGDIEFYLPPGLNAPLGITLTASDTDDLIAVVYRPTDVSVTTITAPPPPFKPKCKVFQIATGRYTAKSTLLEKTGEQMFYKADGTQSPKILWKPQPILKRMLRTILAAASQKRDGDKITFRDTFVVGAKDMVEADDPMIEELRENLFIELTNHHHAEGRNDYQHCEVAFIFHTEPSVAEIKKQSRITYPTEDLSFERQEVDVVVNGVTLEKVMRYTDTRVQKVYNLECEKRLMQAIMRLRPMINEDKLFFLFTAEPVSRLPVTPIPFTLPQLERFLLKENGDIADFEAYLQKIDEQSVQQRAEQEGVSERTIYRQTQGTRKQTKAEQDTELLRKAKDLLKEYSQTATAKKLGISRKKLTRILESVQN